MMAADEPVVTQRFLLEREHAGVSRDALKAVYPRRYWPAEWLIDQKKGSTHDHRRPAS